MSLPAYLTINVRDLWSGKDAPHATGNLTADVAPHAVVMLKVTPARSSRSRQTLE